MGVWVSRRNVGVVAADGRRPSRICRKSKWLRLCARRRVGRGCTAAQSAAITVIPGAVLSGAFDGGLRAYSTKDGSVVWAFDTNREFLTTNRIRAKGGSLNGPAPVVAGGMLFVSSGDYRGRPGNVLLALSVD